jgi:YD repeat-containing protein
MKFFKEFFTICLVFLFSISFVAGTMELETPEASSFTKVEGSEPGADGGVGFNIPLGVVKGRAGMDLPIQLNYASGIKLNQEASWVGLGFGLGFGAISRSPIGVPDDSPGGFLNADTTDYGDQDYYSVSFPGGAGKLIFDNSKTPHIADWNNWKIDIGKNANGKILNWTITTLDGTQYVFDKISNTRSSTINKQIYAYRNDLNLPMGSGGQKVDDKLNSNYAASWYLTKILSADYSDNDGVSGLSKRDSGNWIEIEYNNEGEYLFKYPNPRSTICSQDINCGTSWEPYTVGAAFSWVANHEAGGGDERLIFGSINRDTTMEMVYPTKVTTPLTYAEFDYDKTSRNDGRDYNNKKLARLNRINFYSENEETTPIQNVRFIYANNSEELARGAEGVSTDGRSTLEAIQFVGLNEASMPNINFDYYGRNSPYSTFAWDWWGNYNGKTSNHNYFLNDWFREVAPWTWANIDARVAANGEDHSTTEDITAWSIKNVEYSTGGSVHYEYGVGDYSYVQNVLLTSGAKSAGMILKSKTVDDGIGNEFTVEYEYGDGVATQDLGWQNRYSQDWARFGSHLGHGIQYTYIEKNLPGEGGYTRVEYNTLKDDPVGHKTCIRPYKAPVDGVSLTTTISRKMFVDYAPHRVYTADTNTFAEDHITVEQTASSEYDFIPKALFTDNRYDHSEDIIDCSGGYGSARNEPYTLNVEWMQLLNTESMTNGQTVITEYPQYNEDNGLPEIVDTYGNDGKILRQRTWYEAFDPMSGDAVKDYFVEKNMLGIPSQSVVVEKEDGSSGYEDLKHVVYKYNFFGDDGSGYRMEPKGETSCTNCKVYPLTSHTWVNDTSNYGVADYPSDDYIESGRINIYDKYGQALESEDAKARKTRIFYGANNQCNDDLTGAFSANSLPTCVVDSATNQLKASYDWLNRVDQMTDANGIQSFYNYDNFSRLVKVTNSVDDAYVSTSYNYGLDGGCQEGLLVGNEDCMNWVQTQNNFGTSTGDGKARSYTDGLGRSFQSKILETDTNAIKIRTYYNGRGFVDGVTKPENSEISWMSKFLTNLKGGDSDDLLLGYDEDDLNKDGGSDADTVKYIYYDDPTGRVWKTFPYDVYTSGMEDSPCSDPDVDCVQVEYSPDISCEAGYACEKTTDANGNYIKSKVNKFGHTIEIENAKAETAVLNIDLTGQVIDIFDQEGRHSRHNEYDKLGRLTETTDLNSGKTQYTYDENNNPKTITEAFGTPDQRVKELVYDSQDRVIEIKVNDVIVTKYYYDTYTGIRSDSANKCGNGSSTYGFLCMVEDLIYNNNVRYYYDTKGRIDSITENIEGADYITSYEYDYADNVLSIDYPEGESIGYEYNRMGQLDMIDGQGGMGDVDFEYTSQGTIDTIEFPNGVIQDYDYTVRNWVENISVSNNNGYLFNEQYEYDDVGNLNMIHDLKESTYANFAYDDLYRLRMYGDFSSYNGYYGEGFGAVLLTYDEVGNRETRRVVGNGGNIVDPETYDYLNYNSELGEYSDRLTHTDEDNCDYTYDGHGNMKSKDCNSESSTYVYDSNNMITRIDMTSNRDAPRTLTFRYDSLGRRIYKKSVKFAGELEKGKETIYIYGVGSNPLMVLEEVIMDMPDDVCGNGICELGAGETCAGCYSDCKYQQADCIGRSICDNRRCIEIPYLQEAFIDEEGSYPR